MLLRPSLPLFRHLAISTSTTPIRRIPQPASIAAAAAPARTMSSSSAAPQKHEWLVILPDQPDALERRLAVREQHLSTLLSPTQTPQDRYLLGGAFMDPTAPFPPAPGTAPQMAGSVMLALAESKEQVLEWLKQDVYRTEGVWDWEKVQVYPFKSAIRKGL